MVLFFFIFFYGFFYYFFLFELVLGIFFLGCISLNSFLSLFGQDIVKGKFGIELESLRVVKGDAKLALSSHPSIFNCLPFNKYITNDFSESQVEIVTPCYSSLDRAYGMLCNLYGVVDSNLCSSEMLWNQSMPCILPDGGSIPIAKFRGNSDAVDLISYRNDLLRRYDVKKQLISGVHFNFSFDNGVLHSLYDRLYFDMGYNEFKNQIYLKIARNYQRYCWLIIYLTGASVGVHGSFTDESRKLAVEYDGNGGFYSPYACSFRNSSVGYKNIVDLYPDYSSVESFVGDIKSYIDKGYISHLKELYCQIRLKPYDLGSPLRSLYDDGINYVEVRTLDLNPFERYGISKEDLEFLHVFLIYMLIMEEDDDNECWQEEAVYNENIVAGCVYHKNTKLIENNRKVDFRKAAKKHIRNLYELSLQINPYGDDLISNMEDKVRNPNLNYSKRLISLIKEDGYINSQLDIMSN